jgi:hypothetical protein
LSEAITLKILFGDYNEKRLSVRWESGRKELQLRDYRLLTRFGGGLMSEKDGSFEQVFEELEQLFQRDPGAFEERRKQLIQDMIDNFPEENRAKGYGLQLKIDAELARYKDPVARMNRMVELFWEGVGHFQEVLTDPAKVLQERRAGKEGAEPARVIPFRRLH